VSLLAIGARLEVDVCVSCSRGGAAYVLLPTQRAAANQNMSNMQHATCNLHSMHDASVPKTTACPVSNQLLEQWLRKNAEKCLARVLHGHDCRVQRAICRMQP
jgi:hypothetical protein